MNHRIKISLITPSYNHAEFIQRTVDSVLSQQGDFDLEYRVLDGGSTDGTQEILASYGAQLEWISERDGGQVDAINRGLREATGDIVGWLNSDDVLLQGALAHVAQTFRANSDCLWLHGDCIVIDKSDCEIRRWISAYKRHYAKRFSYPSLLTRNFISQMTVFWRRDLLDTVGYLNPNYKLAFDYDYWLRLASVAPPLYLPQKLAAFRWYETSKSGANFSAQFREDEEIAVNNGCTKLRAKRLSNRMVVSIYNCIRLLRVSESKTSG